MLAVKQENKGKVRPVMDYRELNAFIKSHTGDSEACPETTRKWRSMGDRVGVVDLKNAYLQLHVKCQLEDYQVVRVDGKYYRLTRLGFGLTSAPRIMSAVVRRILSLDPRIAAATDHYIDDIVFDKDIVSVVEVVEHLRKYGLETKPPESLEGARVLGLQLSRGRSGRLMWSRGNDIPRYVESPVTRRELFSLFGRLVGHYPMAGWLRVACGFIKRHSEGHFWDDPVGERVLVWLNEVLHRVQEADPVGGSWSVPSAGGGRVWCDASSLATGAMLEIGGVIVEDAAWLRKKHDAAHINVAELDAVIQGLNMAIRWKLQKIHVLTNSATVRGWMQSVLTNSHRI